MLHRARAVRGQQSRFLSLVPPEFHEPAFAGSAEVSKLRRRVCRAVTQDTPCHGLRKVPWIGKPGVPTAMPGINLLHSAKTQKGLVSGRLSPRPLHLLSTLLS